MYAPSAKSLNSALWFHYILISCFFATNEENDLESQAILSSYEIL